MDATGNNSTKDESLSMTTDSDGQPTITKSTWSFRRFPKAIIMGRPPLAVILISFMTSLAVAAAITAWAITYDAAETSATSLSESLQKATLKQVVSALEDRFKTAEQVTAEYARNWADGIHTPATPADIEKTQQMMFTSLQQRQDVFSALAWVTYPEGHQNGVIWEPTGPNGTTVWLKTRHADGDTNSTLYQNSTTMALYKTWIVDGKDGRDRPVDGVLVTANPRKIRASRFTNDTAKVALGKGWNYEPMFDFLNLNDPKSSAWLPYAIIAFKAGIGFKDFAQVIQRPDGTPVGTFKTSMTMGFLNKALSEATAAIPYRSQVYVLEMGSTSGIFPMADSVNTLYITNDTNAQYPFNKAYLANSRLGQIHDHMASHPGGPSAYFQDRQGGVDMISMPDGNYAMQSVIYTRAAGLKVGIVMLVNRSDVMRALVESNRRAIGIIVAVIVVGVVLSIVFSFMLARALFRITRDLRLLANFKFQEVLQTGTEKGAPARPQYSRIQELFQIQKAFHLMTVNFAKAVSQNRRFGEGMGAKTSTVTAKHTSIPM
ncbi:hypothetical protein DFS34DRAFT_653787 [Phlyctochytrium arcticum]|nr:hypothetical protein DFS34DRAFT_653787 [Phlyctochytrium arcticum]